MPVRAAGSSKSSKLQRSETALTPRPEGLRTAQTSDVLCQNPREPGCPCKYGKGCYYAHSGEEVVLMRAWRAAKNATKVQWRSGGACCCWPLLPLCHHRRPAAEACPHLQHGLPFDYNVLVASLAEQVAVEAEGEQSGSVTSQQAEQLLPTSSEGFAEAFPALGRQASWPHPGSQPTARLATAPKAAPAAAALAVPALAGPPTPPVEQQQQRARQQEASAAQRREPPAAAAMSAAGHMQPVPAADNCHIAAFCCPISLAPFEDPVVAADGLTYERTDISDWLFRRGAKRAGTMGPRVLGATNVQNLPCSKQTTCVPPLCCRPPPRRQQKDTSPCTGERLASKVLVPNRTLRAAMADVAAALAAARRGG